MEKPLTQMEMIDHQQYANEKHLTYFEPLLPKTQQLNTKLTTLTVLRVSYKTVKQSLHNMHRCKNVKTKI